MTKIIVLTSEEDDPTGVGVVSGDIDPKRAMVMCQAAVRHFQELATEAEVLRRVALAQE